MYIIGAVVVLNYIAEETYQEHGADGLGTENGTGNGERERR
jgi:hypothetical protein